VSEAGGRQPAEPAGWGKHSELTSRHGSAGTATAEQVAKALAGRAEEAALCLDFDGTLSPVVDDPEAARPLQGVVELLAPLARRYAAVAIISGRPAAYLAEHVAAPGVRYLGLYGLQEMHDGKIRVDTRLEAARPTVAAALQAAAGGGAVGGGTTTAARCR
jgi:trehalose 6-phosphate phosphatase